MGRWLMDAIGRVEPYFFGSDAAYSAPRVTHGMIRRYPHAWPTSNGA